MARVGVPYYTSAITAAAPLAAETVVATLAGCTVRYPSDHFVIHGFVNLTQQAATTAIKLTVRRNGIAGTVVADTTYTMKAAGDIIGGSFAIDCDDAPGDVANMTYVLTTTLTDAASASAVNDVSLTATLTS